MNLAEWLKGSGLCYTMAGNTCLVFDPPPRLECAHGAAITSTLAAGKRVAQLLRARGWAVCSTRREDVALRWLASLGYKRDAMAGRPVLRVPNIEVFGTSRINLTVVATRVAANPTITTRALAAEMSAAEGRPIDYGAVNRAMIAIGWGPEEREAHRNGVIPAPTLADD